MRIFTFIGGLFTTQTARRLNTLNKILTQRSLSLSTSHKMKSDITCFKNYYVVLLLFDKNINKQ